MDISNETTLRCRRLSISLYKEAFTKTSIWKIIAKIQFEKDKKKYQALRKHAYSNKYIENFTSKNWTFSDKKLIFFIFLLET